MNNQDKLKKLAEMAGVPVQGGRRCAGFGPIWNPLEDMNQALECWRVSGWDVLLIEDDSDDDEVCFSCKLCIALGGWYSGKTEAESLCNALLEIPNA